MKALDIDMVSDKNKLNLSSRPGLIDSACRRLLVKKLNRLLRGMVTLKDGDESVSFGEKNTDLRAEVSVHDPRFYRRAVLGGSLGLAKSLIDGDWSCNDLTSLVRIFIRNLEVSDRFERGFAWFCQRAARVGHWFRRNTRIGAARNIHEHYDLGNDFYQLFLDETMSYSCGIFEQPASTMHDASLAKLERVCRHLNLGPDDHLLEIGTGWGGLAIYAAANYGCQVTTTTISREQFKLAVERVQAAGLSDLVTVLLSDYRDLEGKYDKLVSIEMIEAVGSQFFDTYFQKCSTLLNADGMMLLQSIVIKDQRFQEYLQSVDFIRKYIFPGGCLPSVAAILQSTASHTDMRLLQLEDIAPHYAQTLRCWQQEFNGRLDQVRDLGYSESFIRMWNYYFSYCEAAFEERQCNTVQVLFAKPDCRFDPVRQEAIDTFSFSNESAQGVLV